MLDIDVLFWHARHDPRNPMNAAGRGLGKRAGARFDAARAKRFKAANKGKPFFSQHFPPTKRQPVPYGKFSPKICGVRYRYFEDTLVPR